MAGPPEAGSLGTGGSQGGYTLLEMLLVMVVAVVLVAIAVIGVGRATSYFRASGDVRQMASRLHMAKMQAGASLTQTRLSIDVAAETFQLEEWDKTNSQWAVTQEPYPLSSGVDYGAGSASVPPPGLPNLNHKQPVVFNSRGVPVDGSGSPVSDYAIYLTNLEQTFALTVSIGGSILVWRFDDGVWSSL